MIWCSYQVVTNMGSKKEVLEVGNTAGVLSYSWAASAAQGGRAYAIRTIRRDGSDSWNETNGVASTRSALYQKLL